MAEQQTRYIVNHAAQLLREPQPWFQLLNSLTKIIRNSPPTKPWTDPFKDIPMGLWTGSTSIAYLFLWVSKTYPELVVADDNALSWCLKYLTCGSEDLVTAQGLNGWGVKNEYLAFNAVKAAATQDATYVSKLCDAIKHDFGAADVDNELLSGRAGTLALLRIVRHFVPSSAELVNSCIPPLIDHILGAIPWTFGTKTRHRYIGAAHGDIGILTQVVLSDNGFGLNAAVEAQLNELLDLQAPDGHWFITPDPTLGDDDLVHFCHGSPGFVISFVAMRPFVRPELQARIDRAIELGRREIWEKGILRKQPNLCHGISGNMLAFEDKAQREHFMTFATSEKFEEGVESGLFARGDDPSGLQWGEAGRAWGWMVIDSGLDLGWPGYTDV